jgi:4-hydroxybenzoate polyprenyltransferase
MNLFRRFSNLIVLPHSVFALPFALASLLIAAHRGSTANLAHSALYLLFWVVVAVVSARTAAMAFNRLLDADIDRLNPRTAKREIPLGLVSKRQAAWFTAGAAGLFFVSSFLLGSHCFVLSPFVLGLLFFYSYTKRIGWYAHVVLGSALACAPGGAWWVVRPALEATPLLLMTAVLFWVAGFDVLYSCQDIEFDRENGVYSLPSLLGVETSLHTAAIFHAVSFVFFLAMGISAGMPLIYFIGMALLGGFLLGQHRLISPIDLSRINHAFFTANGVMSLLYLLLIALSLKA